MRSKSTESAWSRAWSRSNFPDQAEWPGLVIVRFDGVAVLWSGLTEANRPALASVIRHVTVTNSDLPAAFEGFRRKTPSTQVRSRMLQTLRRKGLLHQVDNRDLAVGTSPGVAAAGRSASPGRPEVQYWSLPAYAWSIRKPGPGEEDWNLDPRFRMKTYTRFVRRIRRYGVASI